MLPSQTGRSSSSRSHMYRRGRRRRWPMAIGLAAVLIGVIFVFKFVFGTDDPAPASADVGPSVTPAANTSSTAKNQTTPGSQTRSQPERTTVPSKSDSGQTGSPSSVATSQPNSSSTATLPITQTNQKITMGGSVPSGAPGASAAPVQNGPSSNAGNPSSSSSSPQPPSSGLPKADLPRTAPTAPASTTANAPPASGGGPASQRLQAGLTLLSQNKPLDARTALTAALLSPGLSAQDAERARQELTNLNQRLVFSPEVISGDPYALHYTIEAGDSLAKLPRKLGLKVDWRLLQRINRLSAPERIQVGQRIKAVRGPFHAVIHKREFRLDLYMGDADQRVYVRSFRVGLGEHGATPEGAFVVKQNSKLINPAWTNPRTGEFFNADDPNNPLGEYWIGLIGSSDNIRGLETYGIHGTVEPDSIGQLRSMGCVRMLHDDVALIYELLIENASTVEIHGDDYP